MKFLILSALVFVGTSALAETTIRVQCQCSYYVDFLPQLTLADGQQTHPSADDIANCKIENGKVISGCWAAKWNASYNCGLEAERMTGMDGVRRPAVQILEEACYGEIADH